MQHRVTPDEPREVLPCAVQPDGVDDVDSQRELSWPNVGREVNHRRRKYRLEQEVSREVAMNELCRRVTRGVSKRRPRQRASILGWSSTDCSSHATRSATAQRWSRRPIGTLTLADLRPSRRASMAETANDQGCVPSRCEPATISQAVQPWTTQAPVRDRTGRARRTLAESATAVDIASAANRASTSSSTGLRTILPTRYAGPSPPERDRAPTA